MVNYFLFGIYLSLILAFIYWYKGFRYFQLSRIFIALVFIIKLAAGIGLNRLYSRYYTDTSKSDIHKFYEDGMALRNIARNDAVLFIKLMVGLGDESYRLSDPQEKLKNWFPNTDEYGEFTGFKDSNVIHTPRFFIRLNALIAFFSGGFLATHTLLVCFLSFCGFLLFVRTCMHHAPAWNGYMLFSVGLFPSVLLWSSGILKESIYMLCLGMISYFFFMPLTWYFRMLGLFLSGTILFFNSLHIFVLGLFALLMSLAFRYLKWKMLIIPAIGALGLLFIHAYYPAKSPFHYLSSKLNYQKMIGEGGYGFFNTEEKSFHIYLTDTEMNRAKESGKIFETKPKLYFIKPDVEYSLYKQGSISGKYLITQRESNIYYLVFQFEKAGSYIPGPSLEPDLLSCLVYLPTAIKNVFWEPVSNAGKNVLFLIVSAENMLVLIIFMFVLLYFDSKKITHFTFFLFTFSIAYFLLIGFTDVIAGNIVRHKSTALFFFLSACFLTVDFEKLKNRFSRFVPVFFKNLRER